MKKIYPEKLQKGDLVRMIAPACSLKTVEPEVCELAKKTLEDLGLKVESGANVNECDDFKSSSIESRVADLHSAFKDKNCKMIITARGGFNSNQLLRYIDWDLIKNNPKIFCGYSDISALNNAIFAKTGLVNYSGPSFSSLGRKLGLDYTTEYFEKCLFSDEPIEVSPSSKWYNSEKFHGGEDKIINNKGWQIIQEGEAMGTIIGANLCTLNLLHGTEFMPLLENSILFIEDDYESNALNIDRDLQSLIHQPGFEKVKGIVIGRFELSSEVSESLLEQIIKSKKELEKLPVIAGVDFGHTSPKITFPVGGEVKIVADKRKPKIIITKH